MSAEGFAKLLVLLGTIVIYLSKDGRAARRRRETELLQRIREWHLQNNSQSPKAGDYEAAIRQAVAEYPDEVRILDDPEGLWGFATGRESLVLSDKGTQVMLKVPGGEDILAESSHDLASQLVWDLAERFNKRPHF